MVPSFHRERAVRIAGNILLGFVCLCCPVACSLSDSTDQDVVVCIIDVFDGKDSHGEMVRRMVEEYAFGRCRLKTIDVGERRAYEDNEYLVALGDALNYVQNNSDAAVIINISLGSYEKNPREEALVEQLIAHDAMIVASAGNDNRSNKLYPAGFEKTVAVAATWSNRKADYSNHGEHIDIAAPGLAEVRISRREKVPGVTPAERIHYHIRGGTSFAAPRVSGLLAYLLSRRPGLRPAEALDLIKKHARPVGDDYFGKGRLGAGELALFSTLIAEDPFYRKVLISQVAMLLFMLLALFILDREKGLFYFGLIILGPLLVGANLIWISAWDFIHGGIAGTVTTAVAYFLASLCYVAVKFDRRKSSAEE
jgi:hypothetical protein